MNAFSTLALAIVLGATACAASAQENGHAAHGAHGAHAAHTGDAGQQASAASELTDGEVKRIDKETGKITLRHGELKNLNMAAMTMVFRVKDPAMLDQVQVGNKVKFSADRVNGAVTIVQLATVE